MQTRSSFHWTPRSASSLHGAETGSEVLLSGDFVAVDARQLGTLRTIGLDDPPPIEFDESGSVKQSEDVTRRRSWLDSPLPTIVTLGVTLLQASVVLGSIALATACVKLVKPLLRHLKARRSEPVVEITPQRLRRSDSADRSRSETGGSYEGIAQTAFLLQRGAEVRAGTFAVLPAPVWGHLRGEVAVYKAATARRRRTVQEVENITDVPPVSEQAQRWVDRWTNAMRFLATWLCLPLVAACMGSFAGMALGSPAPMLATILNVVPPVLAAGTLALTASAIGIAVNTNPAPRLSVQDKERLRVLEQLDAGDSDVQRVASTAIRLDATANVASLTIAPQDAGSEILSELAKPSNQPSLRPPTGRELSGPTFESP